MSVKLVIFDMDGVVIDSEKVYFRSNQLAAEELGIKGFTMEYYRQFVGAGTEHMIEKMTEDYGDRDLVERFVRLSMDKVYPSLSFVRASRSFRPILGKAAFRSRWLQATTGRTSCTTLTRSA